MNIYERIKQRNLMIKELLANSKTKNIKDLKMIIKDKNHEKISILLVNIKDF